MGEESPIAIVIITPRENEVLQILIREGLTNKEIARKLGITEGTVKVHISALYQKFNCASRSTLIVKMYNNPNYAVNIDNVEMQNISQRLLKLEQAVFNRVPGEKEQ